MRTSEEIDEVNMGAIWKIKGVYKADAEKVFEEFNDIGSKITPQDVLNYAKNENTELHKCFEWDDKIAGHKYRLHQAQKVIECLYITTEDKNVPEVRALQITREKNTYQPTELFIEQPDEYEILLNRALRELESFKKRYSILLELESVFKQIEEVLSA